MAYVQPHTYQCDWQVSRRALDRALAGMSSSSAQGLDAIPAGLVKSLGDVARDTLALIFTAIIAGEPVPADWQCGRVRLVRKKGGDAGNIRDYRPITVTSVMYRLFTLVLKSWMSAWAECSGALTELQNGFRSNRRLEDNLFALSQTIELARKEARSLFACFLDVAKAYDSVPHEPMLSRMAALSMPQPLVDILRRLYENNTVVACLGHYKSQSVPVRRGLKQGCPLSPVLYMLYVSGLEQRLIDSGLGFPFQFLYEGLPHTWVLPGLAFADDLVLLAETVPDIQRLVTLSATHLSLLGLSFNPKKSAVLQFSGSPGVNTVFLPNNDTIPWATEYRYLGVILSSSSDLLGAHEEHLRQSCRRASAVLRRRSMWGCNRYILVRELWKAVHVPALTFANAVVCVSSSTRAWLERGQREVGRVALGCHGRVAVEAIQGDLGWSSFEAREASSKLAFEARLRHMDDQRWARRVFRYMGFKGTQTVWTSRVHTLSRKFGFLAEPLQASGAQKLSHVARKRVREVEAGQWCSAMLAKSTLELYRSYKSTPAAETLYDNDTGSALLFEARAGALRTLQYRQRFDPSPAVQSAICRACGEAQESAEHVTTQCVVLSPTHPEGTTLPQALGLEFHDSATRSTLVTTSKERLRQWWWRTRQSGLRDESAAHGVTDP